MIGGEMDMVFVREISPRIQISTHKATYLYSDNAQQRYAIHFLSPMPAVTVMFRYQSEIIFTAIEVFRYSTSLALDFLHPLILGTYVHCANPRRSSFRNGGRPFPNCNDSSCRGSGEVDSEDEEVEENLL